MAKKNKKRRSNPDLLDNLDFMQKTGSASAAPEKLEIQVENHKVAASYGYSTMAYSQSYDGAKNTGEAGPIINWVPNYYRLSLRSWQSYTENEITKTILDKYCIWIIDKGLKLQSNPSKKILALKKINLESEEFNEICEALFMIWAGSSRSSYNGSGNLNSISKDAFRNAKIGGDTLVILRYDGVNMNVQLIDGAHVTNNYSSVAAEGNTITNGVETDDKGRVVAYHVCIDFKTERIPAYNSLGLKTAFLVFGNKHRLDFNRGMPAISVVIETLKKLDRYKEATVGSAEERQKIAYTIVHDINSDGSSPLIQRLAYSRDKNLAGNGELPTDSVGNAMARTVAVSTNKQTFNMPPGSQLKALESDNELSFKEFYETNAHIICAALGIPPNVAMSMYNNSFSASRAATKDWDHTIDVNRDDFSTQFYQPIYEFFLHINILNGNIKAPGYMAAFLKDDWMVLEAYRNCRFTGPLFPHIDPVKEVTAERLKLGETGAHLPLTTQERATEALNGGDPVSNMEQYSKELNYAQELGINPVIKSGAVQESKEEKDEEEENIDEN